MGELYDQDVFEWSGQQASLPCRHAAGGELNEARPGESTLDALLGREELV